ncbi:hypothetical protein ACX80L_01730 [Arthrobacter sp. MDT1-48-3]
MGTIDDEAALTISLVGDLAPGTDATVQVPGEMPPGVPFDPLGMPASTRPGAIGLPDYADVAALRAGDSVQTFVAVPDGDPEAELPGFLDSGSGGGDGGGD